MALIIEDGTIVAGAQSYVSASDATAYHTARGNTAWTGTDAVKEAALLKAAAYLDGYYRSRWRGVKLDFLVQSLEWPRVNFYQDLKDNVYLNYSTGIPQRLKDAQSELALIALSSELAPSMSTGIKREKVDVLETEYFPGAKSGALVYMSVENLISDLILPKNSGNVIRA